MNEIQKQLTAVFIILDFV